MNAKIAHKETFVDAVVKTAGTIAVLFDSALLNEISIDASPVPGTIVEINENNELLQEELSIPNVKAITTKQVTLFENQNLIDLTIQSKGTIESLFDFGLENETSIDTSPVPGTKFMVPASGGNDEIVNYYKERGLKPATGKLKKERTYFIPGYIAEGYFETKTQ